MEWSVFAIIALVTFAIMLIVLVRSGMINNLLTLICTITMTATNFTRGIAIHFMWIMYWVIFGLLALILLVYGNFCRNPVGAIACAAMYAIVVAILAGMVSWMIGSIPLFYCTNPDINLQHNKDCGSGVATEVFMKEVAERSVDCFSMYTNARYDPLAGKTPPNPRTCFVINFNLAEPIVLPDIMDWMQDNEINDQTNQSYMERIGGVVVINNGSADNIWYTQKITKGRLFIKYGDDHLFAKWWSPDCNIRWSYKPDPPKTYWDRLKIAMLTYYGTQWCPMCTIGYHVWQGLQEYDYVYWCLDIDSTCDENCNYVDGGAQGGYSCDS